MISPDGEREIVRNKTGLSSMNISTICLVEFLVLNVVRVSTIPPEIEGLEVRYENGSIHRLEVSSSDALPVVD